MYGFVHPQTGKTEWHILPRVNVDWFNISLAEFALAVGAGKDKLVVLVIDRARWHTSERVVIPQGIHLEPLPPYSPQLQPAQRLWALADEPLVNEHFDTLEQLEKVLAQRCCVLSEISSEISALTNYYWWPSTSTG